MTELVAGALAPTATGDVAGGTTKVLSVRQLAWRKFRKNRLAVFGLVVLTIMYVMAAFAGFLAPYGDRETHAEFARIGPASDGWALARASNTQPVLVLRFESTSEEGLNRIRQSFESIVHPML